MKRTRHSESHGRTHYPLEEQGIFSGLNRSDRIFFSRYFIRTSPSESTAITDHGPQEELRDERWVNQCEYVRHHVEA